MLIEGHLAVHLCGTILYHAFYHFYSLQCQEIEQIVCLGVDHYEYCQTIQSNRGTIYTAMVVSLTKQSSSSLDRIAKQIYCTVNCGYLLYTSTRTRSLSISMLLTSIFIISILVAQFNAIQYDRPLTFMFTFKSQPLCFNSWLLLPRDDPLYSSRGIPI